MSYTVIIENKAQKEFLILPESHANSVKKTISNLEKEPRPQGSKKLFGKDDEYRIRIGDYRILNSIDSSRKFRGRTNLITFYIATISIYF